MQTMNCCLFGAASVAAGFSQSMPIGASGSRTAVNDSMKATSQVSGLVSFATIVLILPFLTAPIQYPDAGITPEVVVYRIQDRLFFANAHFFKRRVWAAVDGAPKPVRHLVLDAAMISGVDASAVGAVREVQAGLLSRNIAFEVARATDELREQFEETGLTGLIGPEHFYGTVGAAVEACVQSSRPTQSVPAARRSAEAAPRPAT